MADGDDVRIGPQGLHSGSIVGVRRRAWPGNGIDDDIVAEGGV